MSIARTRLIAVVLFLSCAQVQALQLTVNLSFPFVFIQIGHGLISSFGMFGPPAGLIDEVAFTFPGGVQPGDGTPVAGMPVIPIMVLGYSGGNRVRFVVTMNSSVPLVNADGDTIPFSDFSWTTRDGDIPAGAFDGTTQQQLVSMNVFYPRGRGMVDYLTFSYSNANVYPAGNYQGRVVYTVTNL